MSETAAPPAGESIDFHKRIEQFLTLRDHIKQKDDAHAAAMKPAKDLLLKLNAEILAHLNASGSDSVSVRGVGTAYKTVKDSASIADGEEFKRWIIGGNLWEMVDWKANVPATREYILKNNAPPPGINFSSVAVVGVRRL